MKKNILFLCITALLINCQLYAQTQNLKSLYEKENLTIVITDSGLGGLSVVAEMENLMKNSGHFKNIDLIFVNALFSEKGGYNGLSDRSEKVDIFSDVLTGIEKEFHPDLIMVACNTLSTILPETNFSKNTTIPTIGIVEIGVSEIKKRLDQSPDSEVIIFGTETTIAEDSYPSQLILEGINKTRISSKACPQLQEYIETDPAGDDTEMLIMSYVDEALEQVGPTNKEIFVSLNCTHYGYATDLWMSAFEFSGVKPKGIINPNQQMSKIFTGNVSIKKFSKTDVSVQVVSKVKINKKNIESISKILKKTSLASSNALNNYQLMKELF